MGIGLRNTSWAPVIAANRQQRKPCICEAKSARGTYCLIHGREHTGADTSNIHTTPEVEAALATAREKGSSRMGQKFYKGPIRT